MNSNFGMRHHWPMKHCCCPLESCSKINFEVRIVLKQAQNFRQHPFLWNWNSQTTEDNFSKLENLIIIVELDMCSNSELRSATKLEFDKKWARSSTSKRRHVHVITIVTKKYGESMKNCMTSLYVYVHRGFYYFYY